MSSEARPIKVYQEVDPDNTELSFDLKRMEDIYDRNQGIADEPHRHNFYIVLLVKKASGKHLVDFKEFDMGAHQIYFLSPGQVHQLIATSRPEGYAIVFSTQFMLESGIEKIFIDDLHLFEDFGNRPPLNPGQEGFQEIWDFAHKIHQVQGENHALKYAEIGSWLKLLLIRCNQRCLNDSQDNPQKAQASFTLLRNLKGLLENHFKEWHQVKEYAQAMNVTPDYLNTSVKSLTGKSAKEHIQSRITVAAKRMLYFTELSNKEISYELGFSEPANFSSFFKKCTGISPSSFRQKR
ncbi:AraC family transcriptional regulator [bacterium SCSIO 12741]|nr:AraC family transcriptional regulator [bacterium SCSIO 12741]